MKAIYRYHCLLIALSMSLLLWAAPSGLCHELVGYWPFNGDANDVSGYGNHGTVYGASLTADRLGNANSAYLFNGSSSYIEVINPNSIPTNGSRSFAMWVKYNRDDPGYNNPELLTISDYTCTSGLNPFGIIAIPMVPLVTKTIGIGAENDLYTKFRVFVSDANVGDSSWHFLVTGYDSQSSNLFIYTDGVLAGSTSVVDFSHSAGNILIGGRTHSYSGYTAYFKGAIDDVQIYNYALTAGEVLSLYQGITFPAPSGISASDGTYTNRIRVTWNAVAGAMYYELWRNTSNSSASAFVLAQITNSVTYDDATVTAGVSYCYWVKAKSTQATSAFSDSDSGYAALSTVSGYANLEVADVILLPTTLSVGGHPGAAGLQLMNWGPCDMTAPNTRMILDFFLSKNTTFGDEDDLWLGNYKTDVTLSSGSYALVAVTTSAREGFTVPSGAVGKNYVFARVRHTYPSVLGDSDESNNYAMRSGTITVTGSNTAPSAGYHLVNDYDGDGKSDLALYKEATGEWLVMLSGSGDAPAQFVLGGKDYQPVIADYDGDGKADPAVCNQKTGEWQALFSASGYSLATFNFGGHTETPVPIDYDGDGKADPAIYQQSGAWVMLMSGSGYAAQTMTLGDNNYVPVPADYDGDGISDLAVYRSSTGDWILKLSTLDYWTMTLRFGGSGAIPIPADYDGDGKADPAVYKESSGDWSVMMSRFDYLTAGATFGGHGWVPVAADYDGDGKEDLAIYNDDQHLLKVLVSGSDYGLITKDAGGLGYEPVGWPR